MEQFLALLTFHGYSRMIAQMENVDEHTLFITELAAYLHDIGVKISKEKYGNSQPQHQEAEGPIIARQLLALTENDSSRKQKKNVQNKLPDNLTNKERIT